MHEYAQELRSRYFKASRGEKGRMLDEFTRVTGLHRKAAIRLLNRRNQSGTDKRCGRPRRYGVEAAEALKHVWEASDRLCSKRLQPFLPEMVKALSAHAELRISEAMEEQLYRMSPSTIDRLLKPYRQIGGRKQVSTTRVGSLLKRAIPIRTFADWEENRPGFVEADLVAHCGESTEGFYLTTLSAVDVASGWTECIGIWGKGQQRVRAGIHNIRCRLPFPLLGLDSDNGGEFINQCLYEYCREKGITFTRSRSYKKNDSCHIEQKNGNVVRRFVGYDRYTSRTAVETLNRVYSLVRLYINFFQPTMKLISKTRNGARVRKVYDTAQTPYRRLVQFGILTEEKKAELDATYSGLNPVQLLKQINSNLENLWRLAERS
jgi:hypothetical protein